MSQDPAPADPRRFSPAGPSIRHSRAGGNPRTNAPRRNVNRDSINYTPRRTPKAGHLFTSGNATPFRHSRASQYDSPRRRRRPLVRPNSPASPFVIPAPPFVIPAPPFVIPAQAGIQAPSPREGTTFAIRSPSTSRGDRRRPATCSPPASTPHSRPTSLLPRPHFVIPAPPFVIPALPFVIPAQAGIQAPSPREGTTFAIPPSTSRGKRRRPATCSPPARQRLIPAPPSLLPRPHFVIPAPPFVIPAQAGIQAPTPRDRTPIAMPPTKSA